MWAIRVLTGPQAGQIFPLKNGKNKIGRVESADIVLSSNGISKEHLEISVYSDKMVVSDLKSSNGTFLNGVRVQTALLKKGDKLGAHEILFEIIPAPEVTTASKSAPIARTIKFETLPPPVFQPPPPSQAPRPSAAPAMGAPMQAPLQGIHGYLENVMLPGVYRLVEVFEYKTVMMGFAVTFIFLVTLLSIVPMKQITSESIQTTSRRRAQTVARALANANEKVISQGDLSKFSTEFVLREDGIDDVYIVSKDGQILAPPERAGGRPKEAGFLKQIQGQTKEIAGPVGSDRVAAAYPIISFDPEMQQNVARAHAVVIFNVASLQFDDGRALGMLVQMLAIALIVGLVLFYFMFKLVEYPLRRVTEELDNAFREGHDHATVQVKFSAVQDLLVNVNSLLSRSQSSQSTSGMPQTFYNRDQEMRNLCQLMGYPTLVLNREGLILAANSGVEALMGLPSYSIVNQNFAMLPDQALQKNIQELMTQVQAQSHETHSDSLDIGGHAVRIHCQALVNGSGEIDYYIVAFAPQEQEGAA